MDDENNNTDSDDEPTLETTSDVCVYLFLTCLLPVEQTCNSVIRSSVTIAQTIVLEHGEHTYYGDSDLEYFDDEKVDVPEQSNSECKSDVSCFYFFIAMHNPVQQIRVTLTITSCWTYFFR